MRSCIKDKCHQQAGEAAGWAHVPPKRQKQRKDSARVPLVSCFVSSVVPWKPAFEWARDGAAGGAVREGQRRAPSEGRAGEERSVCVRRPAGAPQRALRLRCTQHRSAARSSERSLRGTLRHWFQLSGKPGAQRRSVKHGAQHGRFFLIPSRANMTVVSVATAT